MKIKSIRFVYEVKTFYGNRKQVDDETIYVTKELLQKSFRELKKSWMTTALWVHCEEVNYGILYDRPDDVANGVVKFIEVTNNGNSTEYNYLPVSAVKSFLYKMF